MFLLRVDCHRIILASYDFPFRRESTFATYFVFRVLSQAEEVETSISDSKITYGSFSSVCTKKKQRRMPLSILLDLFEKPIPIRCLSAKTKVTQEIDQFSRDLFSQIIFNLLLFQH